MTKVRVQCFKYTDHHTVVPLRLASISQLSSSWGRDYTTVVCLTPLNYQRPPASEHFFDEKPFFKGSDEYYFPSYSTDDTPTVLIHEQLPTLMTNQLMAILARDLPAAATGYHFSRYRKG